MNVSLTPQLEKFVKQKVESGMYGSASEVIREALRFMEERERRLEELRGEIQKGLDSGPSELLDMQEIKAEARRRFEQQKSKAR
ncbi:MAG: type II toxin-antitoxin system ParD family antitoxin [Ardenticatenaceae bacterium]